MSTTAISDEWKQVEEVLNSWKEAFRNSQRAHFHCANFYRRCSLVLGLSLVICTAVVGNSALSDTWRAGSTAQRVFLALTVLSTILAAAQTFLRLDETSEKYRAAGSGFIALRVQVETYLALPRDRREPPERFLDAIGKKRESLTAHAPALPQRVYERYYKKTLDTEH